MSQLLDLFLKSDKLRPTQARQIPDQAVDYFDREHKVQEGFTTFEKVGDASKFTEAALNNYDKELTEINIPASFVPLDPKVPLNQWNPKNKYYNPGAGDSGVTNT